MWKLREGLRFFQELRLFQSLEYMSLGFLDPPTALDEWIYDPIAECSIKLASQPGLELLLLIVEATEPLE